MLFLLLQKCICLSNGGDAPVVPHAKRSPAIPEDKQGFIQQQENPAWYPQRLPKNDPRCLAYQRMPD